MAQRKLISRDNLDAWMTSEIQKFEDCEGSSLSVQYLLAELDGDGCNWSGVIIKAGSKTTAAQLHSIAASVVDKARTLFNLAE